MPGALSGLQQPRCSGDVLNPNHMKLLVLLRKQEYKWAEQTEVQMEQERLQAEQAGATQAVLRAKFRSWG